MSVSKRSKSKLTKKDLKIKHEKLIYLAKRARAKTLKESRRSVI